MDKPVSNTRAGQSTQKCACSNDAYGEEADAVVIAAAGAKIHLAVNTLDALRPSPALQVLGVGPYLGHEVA